MHDMRGIFFTIPDCEDAQQLMETAAVQVKLKACGYAMGGPDRSHYLER
jgi:hypothetical protein